MWRKTKLPFLTSSLSRYSSQVGRLIQLMPLHCQDLASWQSMNRLVLLLLTLRGCDARIVWPTKCTSKFFFSRHTVGNGREQTRSHHIPGKMEISETYFNICLLKKSIESTSPDEISSQRVIYTRHKRG